MLNQCDHIICITSRTEPSNIRLFYLYTKLNSQTADKVQCEMSIDETLCCSDGTRNKDWQPYAALVAAAFMKSVICGMEPPADD